MIRVTTMIDSLLAGGAERVAVELACGLAELSGFLPARDGWVRTHANYDHHRRRLLSALDLPDDTAPALLAARIATLDALDVDGRELLRRC